MERAPVPVLLAMTVFGLFAVGGLAVVVIAVAGVGPAGLFALFLPLIAAFCALGLWQGNRGARLVAVGFGILIVPVAFNADPNRDAGPFSYVVAALGILLTVLLLVPQSSRAWFTSA